MPVKDLKVEAGFDQAMGQLKKMGRGKSQPKRKDHSDAGAGGQDEDLFSNPDEFEEIPIPVFETHQQPAVSTMSQMYNGEASFKSYSVAERSPIDVHKSVD